MRDSKSSHWKITAFLVIAAVGVATVVTSLWAYSRTRGGAAQFGTLGRLHALMKEGRKGAPPRELRKLGCFEAYVFEGAYYRQRAEASDATDAVGLRNYDDGDVLPSAYVACQSWPGRTPPSCEEVAATYRQSVVTPAGDYEVVSGVPLVCRQMYSASGTKLYDLPVTQEAKFIVEAF